MVKCELDPDVSGEILGLKLPTWQALLLHRVLPSCGGFVLFMTVMCYDIAAIYENYNNGHTGIGAFSIMVMVLPAVISLIFTLASPPHGLETVTSAWSVSMKKNEVRWVVMQFVNCLFFPIAGIGRYCHQIFWWVEAVYAVRARDEARIKEALNRARAPSPLELYLFLQAFLHSAPLALMNILDLMMRFNNPAFAKMSVQGVSIVAGTLRMASMATVYRRFEREKLDGRKYPWSYTKQAPDSSKNIIEKKTEEPIYEPIVKKQSLSSERSFGKFTNTESPEFTNRTNANSDFIQFSPTRKKSMPWEESDSDSGNSSDYLPPEVRSGNSRRSSVNSDDEYVRPISIIEKVAPRRRETQYTIQEVKITPPPAAPAPRMSFAVWADKIVENAESIPHWLSAPPRHKHVEQYMIPEEPELPRRVPRSYMRGLEPQDITAALVQFLGWYAFFVSRLVSIAAFIDSVPVIAIIILMIHYQIMLLLLIVPKASTVKRGFYIFLAFIYLFCLMEFKIRFRHVRVWHVFWIIVNTIQAIVFTAVWSNVDNIMTDWWKLYVVKVIFYSLLLSYMCLLVYFVILKPRETIVYINKNNVSNK